MRFRVVKFVIILFIFCSSTVFAESVLFAPGYLDGNRFLQMSKSEQTAYAMGLIDGMLFSPIFGATSNKDLSCIEYCSVNMTNIQITTILTKYLEDNPGKWHHPVNAIMYEALKKSCNQ